MLSRRVACLPPLVAVLGLALFSCQSMQNHVVEGVTEENLQRLRQYEERILAIRLQPGSTDLAAVRRELKDLSNKESLNKAYQAQVLGLYGEAEWLAGLSQDVQRIVGRIADLNTGEARLYVLKSFLARDADKIRILEEGVRATDRPALVHLYLGEQYYIKGLYAPAAASFDEAFAGLPKGYREIYGEMRNRAFMLKDQDAPTSGKSAQYLAAGSLTVEQMIGLTLAETKFLDHIAPGKSTAPDKLLARLKEAGYLPGTISTVADPAPRRDVAFFVYRLVSYLENNTAILSAYHAQYSMANASPVPDVPVDSPCFDAVLGLVERELFDLPDGVHFFPDRTVSGVELYTMLTRMKELYR